MVPHLSIAHYNYNLITGQQRKRYVCLIEIYYIYIIDFKYCCCLNII